MELYKEQVCKLRLTDFNCYKQLRASAVLDLFQDLATEHSVEMGIGFEDLQKKGVFWVVVRQKLEFFHDAVYKPHQEVCVRTWPHSASRLNIQRDYSLSDLDGNMLAKGTSEWLLLDIETRGIASVLANYDGPTDFLPDRMFSGKLRKIKDFEAAEQPTAVIVPQFSDIDFNLHVNNARYIDYAQNVVPPTQDKPVRTLQIDYRKEILPGHPVSIFTLEDEMGTHVKGVNAEGEVYFNCLMGY